MLAEPLRVMLMTPDRLRTNRNSGAFEDLVMPLSQRRRMGYPDPEKD